MHLIPLAIVLMDRLRAMLIECRGTVIHHNSGARLAAAGSKNKDTARNQDIVRLRNDAILHCIGKLGVEAMAVGPIQPFQIESEADADDYLRDLFKKPEFRSLDEVRVRAQKYIKSGHLKNYFINKASERLKK